MRFFLHGELGNGVAAALAEHGHASAVAEDLALTAASAPAQVLEACRVRQHELISGSREFIDAALPGSGRNAVFGRVMVYLHDRHEEHELAVHRLFERYKRLTPGRLYTVTGGRVKVRQLPSSLSQAANP